MNKTKWIIILLIVALVGIIVIIFAGKSQKNIEEKAENSITATTEMKESSLEPESSESNSTIRDTDKSDVTPADNNEYEHEADPTGGRISFEKNGIKYEVIGYEIYSDKELDEKKPFPTEGYAMGERFTPYMTSTYLDTEKIIEEAPEMDKVYNHGDELSFEENSELITKYHDIIMKYFVEEPYDSIYVFVKCKMTNIDWHGRINGRGISLSEELVLCADLYPDTVDDGTYYYPGGYPVYFDKSQRIGQDDISSFFEYPIVDGETIEFTIGYQFGLGNSDINNWKFYFGFKNKNIIEKSGIEGLLCSDTIVRLSNTEADI